MRKSSTKNTTYNYGIDLLKIISTLMIIVMHIINWGGVMMGTSVGSSNYYVAWMLESICFVAVNLYGLTTGYLNVKKEIKKKSFINLWFQVVFYTVVFSGLFAIFMPSAVTSKTWIKAFIPILSNQYWYFTQYFILFLVMPYLNKLLNSLSEKNASKLILALVASLSLVSTIRNYDLFVLGSGYSAAWLITLYLIGGYIALYKNKFKLSNIKAFGIWLFCTLLTFGSKIGIDILFKFKTNSYDQTGLISYTSITVLIASIIIIMKISSMDVKRFKSPIKFIGKLTFGIYLVHVNDLVWNNIFVNAFSRFSSYNPVIMTLAIICAALSVFVISGLIEFIRKSTFKLLHVDSLSGHIANIWERVEDKFLTSIGR